MDWQALLQEAKERFDEGRNHEALQLCDRAALADEVGRYRSALLRGEILLAVGDVTGALSTYESVADPAVPDAQVDCGRGMALFELGKFAEAELALHAALRQDPMLAGAYFALGVMAEIQGSGGDVEYFRRARQLDAENYPAPFQLSREAFTEVLQEAVEGLPAHVRENIAQCRVVVAELPHPDDVQQDVLPISPLALGVLVPAGSGMPPSAAPPQDTQQPMLVFFKRNLERSLEDRAELLWRIRDVCLHELDETTG